MLHEPQWRDTRWTEMKTMGYSGAGTFLGKLKNKILPFSPSKSQELTFCSANYPGLETNRGWWFRHQSVEMEGLTCNLPTPSLSHKIIWILSIKTWRGGIRKLFLSTFNMLDLYFNICFSLSHKYYLHWKVKEADKENHFERYK